MRHDFSYLKYKYGDGGAREQFEHICEALLRAKYGSDVHVNRLDPGDDGIDIMVGDYSAPCTITSVNSFSAASAKPRKTRSENPTRPPAPRPATP